MKAQGCFRKQAQLRRGAGFGGPFVLSGRFSGQIFFGRLSQMPSCQIGCGCTVQYMKRCTAREAYRIADHANHPR
jgi:hypothetical protein